MRKFKVTRDGIFEGYYRGDLLDYDGVLTYYKHWDGDVSAFNNFMRCQIEEIFELNQEQSMISHWAE